MKKLFVPLLILIVLSAAVVVRFFTIPVVTIVCAPYEELFLKKVIHGGLAKGYRVSFSEERPDGPYLATPSINVEEGRGQVFSSQELVFEPDERAMWEKAYSIADETFTSALLFDSTSLHEIGLQKAAPEKMVRCTYDGRISSVQASVLQKKLAEDKVQTLVVYNPKSSLDLLRRDEGYSIITTDLYAVALETVKVSHTVGPDYRAMIEMVLDGKKGSEKVPYVLLPVKQRFEVLLDHIL